MATQQRLIREDHFLHGEDEVFLTITIGSDQVGGNRLVRFSDSVDVLASGRVTNLPLGKGSSLLGRTLEVITNFYDRNPNTNIVTALYNFHSGRPPLHVYYDEAKEGEFFVFHLFFHFKPAL